MSSSNSKYRKRHNRSTTALPAHPVKLSFVYQCFDQPPKPQSSRMNRKQLTSMKKRYDIMLEIPFQAYADEATDLWHANDEFHRSDMVNDTSATNLHQPDATYPATNVTPRPVQKFSINSQLTRRRQNERQRQSAVPYFGASKRKQLARNYGQWNSVSTFSVNSPASNQNMNIDNITSRNPSVPTKNECENSDER